ncbi:dilute domain-containing protein [Reticulomyxa filosa]|uniref:Dilute domain-containing protein n=1 Tax=Reticulomyxa filosa TaxID=46433 RepID=X6MLC7_RETFI|nr:dilute domain-containing protein [Reticulomyxa filosa]|eukprot:ETO14684.1 dilute domain-containing protein [Reticulomyxa filosa]
MYIISVLLCYSFVIEVIAYYSKEEVKASIVMMGTCHGSIFIICAVFMLRLYTVYQRLETAQNNLLRRYDNKIMEPRVPGEKAGKTMIERVQEEKKEEEKAKEKAKEMMKERSTRMSETEMNVKSLSIRVDEAKEIVISSTITPIPDNQNGNVNVNGNVNGLVIPTIQEQEEKNVQTKEVKQIVDNGKTNADDEYEDEDIVMSRDVNSVRSTSYNISLSSSAIEHNNNNNNNNNNLQKSIPLFLQAKLSSAHPQCCPWITATLFQTHLQMVYVVSAVVVTSLSLFQTIVWCAAMFSSNRTPHVSNILYWMMLFPWGVLLLNLAYLLRKTIRANDEIGSIQECIVTAVATYSLGLWWTFQWIEQQVNAPTDHNILQPSALHYHWSFVIIHFLFGFIGSYMFASPLLRLLQFHRRSNRNITTKLETKASASASALMNKEDLKKFATNASGTLDRSHIHALERIREKLNRRVQLHEYLTSEMTDEYDFFAQFLSQCYAMENLSFFVHALIFRSMVLDLHSQLTTNGRFKTFDTFYPHGRKEIFRLNFSYLTDIQKGYQAYIDASKQTQTNNHDTHQWVDLGPVLFFLFLCFILYMYTYAY